MSDDTLLTAAHQKAIEKFTAKCDESYTFSIGTADKNEKIDYTQLIKNRGLIKYDFENKARMLNSIIENFATKYGTVILTLCVITAIIFSIRMMLVGCVDKDIVKFYGFVILLIPILLLLKYRKFSSFFVMVMIIMIVVCMTLWIECIDKGIIVKHIIIDNNMLKSIIDNMITIKFSDIVMLLVFASAFFQWQSSKKQTSISEMFERKKSTNKLIIEHGGKLADILHPVLGDKGENATSEDKKATKKDEEATRKIVTKKEDIKTKLLDFAKKVEHNKIETEIEMKKFIEKMFVYIELDNLEFALAKYVAGYLDDEQMYRACEIFESRCKGRLFRHLAVIQGLGYYTEELHNLVCCCLINGYNQSIKE